MKACIFIIVFVLSLCKVEYAHATSCTFCKPEIVQELSVFESDYYWVLVDHEPRVRGHLLVIPKRHSMKAHELSSEEWKDLSVVIPKAVQVFSNLLDTDQYIIIEKNGPSAFQQVPHVHFHLFPVRFQKWSEIFDIIPKRLSPEEYEKEIDIFRSHFLSVQ